MNVKDVLEKQETKELECKVFGHIVGSSFFNNVYGHCLYTCANCRRAIVVGLNITEDERKLNER